MSRILPWGSHSGGKPGLCFECGRELGIQAQSRAKRFGSLDVAVLQHVGVGQIDPHFDGIGIETGGFLKLGECFPELTLFCEGHAESVMGFGALRAVGDGGPDMFHPFGEMPLADQ